MAKPRSKTHLSALDVGGSDSSVSIELAIPGEYPEDYQEESAVWKTGYDIAARIGNVRKACITFANNYQGEDLSDDAIASEIARLEQIKKSRAS